MKTISIVALILIIVGGINWGLVGLFNFNLVTALFGEGSLLSNTVFILVGISALYAGIAVLPKAVKQVTQ